MNRAEVQTTGIAGLGAIVQPRMIWLSIGFAVAMVAATAIRVWLPFSPVPVTLQTFVVLLAGLSLGATWGGFSQVQYVILGALGLPAFAGGLAALFGPSGGYIIGFVVAAVIVGAIYSAWRTTPGAIVACLAGTAAIYVFGCIWLLALSIGSVAEVAAIGVLPFLPGDVLKLAAAVALVRAPLTGSAIRRLCGHH